VSVVASVDSEERGEDWWSVAGGCGVGLLKWWRWLLGSF
jgi:hypothetical protein